MTDHKFQVHLRGMIDLLSQHLYSSPQVFIRELLQNAVDAAAARRRLEPAHAGRVVIEAVPAPHPTSGGAGEGASGGPSLVFEDDGIGLTEEQAHRFLATIGESSKRDLAAGLEGRRGDFIGQFGIGLLSCFVVSDEIVVITRSAEPGHPAVEWRGRADGTYRVRTLTQEIAPGTRVYLRAKPGREEYFAPDRVRELAAYYGSMLPLPIAVVAEGRSTPINDEPPPWRRGDGAGRAAPNREALLAYGRDTLGQDFLDAIPLRSPAGGVEGVAFVLPESPGPQARGGHRVYLKNMLLTESGEGLLPDWAFFVRCVVNVADLHPTASREGFYEDDALERTREALGDCLRDYLVAQAAGEPERLSRLIAVHHLAIKALAVFDDEFYRLFIPWLPFETTAGRMSLEEYRRAHRVVRYVPTRDQFRQVERVAAAQGVCLINAGYVYDKELLARLPVLFPGAEVEEVDAGAVAQEFEEPTLGERDEAFAFLRAADVLLQPFRCGADLRKFRPAELPALYSTAADASFLRAAEETRETADPLWAGLVGKVAPGRSGPYAQLCFNLGNALVRRLAKLNDPSVWERVVPMLYAQALLMGHHPLSGREMALLQQGMLDLIEWGLGARRSAEES